MHINLIAIVDEDGGLGKDNALLCHLPEDLKRFKQITMSHPIIMGRKTFESIGKALPGRLNIVLSRQGLKYKDCTTVGSLNEALAITSSYPEVFIIGGAALFHQVLPFAERMYLTVIHHRFEADVYFPKFNPMDWQCVNQDTFVADARNHYDMTFYEWYKTSTENAGSAD